MTLAKARKPVGAEQVEAIETNTMPVVRDSTFHRATVDNIFVLPAGEDIELTCLQSGQHFTQLSQVEGFVKLNSISSFTEVARLRMSWAAAFPAAMNILRLGIESGNIDRKAVIEKFSAMEAADESDGD